MPKPRDGLYILLISVHGLIRGQKLELGRDADTGGQTKYVVELAKALGENSKVGKVDLVTRLIVDQKVDSDYGQALEPLSEKVTIVRLACGPKRYLRKEVLWPYLDILVDNILQYLKLQGRTPDIVHAHYADAGYAGARLVQLLGLPFVFTGHSLGRVKKQRLLEKGSKESSIESQYNISQRIEAEEITLGNASLVITSTHQEVQEQYCLYDNYHPRRLRVIPPGVEMSPFINLDREILRHCPMAEELKRFLNHPDKPIILALSRPDERKNIGTLIKAFGSYPQLHQKANLVIVAGNREDIGLMDKGAREVLSNILLLIDRYDLYGKVAYPKRHESTEVAQLYGLARFSSGVFVNPALTEPFGLTLVEAAACGLPLVATKDGGPQDIIDFCKNGLLVDPLDVDEMAQAIMEVLADKKQWEIYSRNSAANAPKYFSWQSHVSSYIHALEKLSSSRRISDLRPVRKNRLLEVEKLIVCDIDNTLLGDEQGLADLIRLIESSGGRIGLAVATGRRLDSALEVLEKWNVPVPDVLITAVGSEIAYGHSMIEDTNWKKHIDYRWNVSAIRDVVGRLPGLKLQKSSEQRRHKISYLVNPKKMKPIREMSGALRKRDLHAKLIYSHDAYLDVLPIRASKGLAIRYLAMRWSIQPHNILVAGDSGNDEEMLKGNTLGVVVGNYSSELAKLKNRPHVYFAEACYAKGIQEGIEHYRFLNSNASRSKELEEIHNLDQNMEKLLDV